MKARQAPSWAASGLQPGRFYDEETKMDETKLTDAQKNMIEELSCNMASLIVGEAVRLAQQMIDQSHHIANIITEQSALRAVPVDGCDHAAGVYDDHHSHLEPVG